MSKEKQIEEMAKVSCSTCLAGGEYCDYEPKPCEAAIKDAEALYNEGYRKQSEGEWVKSDETTEHYGYLYMCSYCGGLNFIGKYCPNCGAKMKGGEDNA